MLTVTSTVVVCDARGEKINATLITTTMIVTTAGAILWKFKTRNVCITDIKCKKVWSYPMGPFRNAVARAMTIPTPHKTAKMITPSPTSGRVVNDDVALLLALAIFASWYGLGGWFSKQ